MLRGLLGPWSAGALAAWVLPGERAFVVIEETPVVGVGIHCEQQPGRGLVVPARSVWSSVLPV